MTLPARLRFLALATFAACTLAACSSDGGSNAPSVASVVIDPVSVALQPGQTRQLTASPRDGSGAGVAAATTWASSNAGVATVSQTGLVTAVVIGTATITATAGGRTATAPVTVSANATTTVPFNVQSTSACTAPDVRSFRKVAEGTRAVFYEDVSNPGGGFTTADYQVLSQAFDGLVWRVNTANFGEPLDIDGNGKVNVLYTRAVNELTASGSSSYIGGFFFGRDLFPKNGGVLLGTSFGTSTCVGSNQGEMFYMLAPDPNGEVNGNRRAVDFVKGVTVATLAHEFEHLINASRRLYTNGGGGWPQEASWLDEGLAHIAEELSYYDATGSAPGRNIGIDDIRSSQASLEAFNAYQNSNLGRSITHLQTVVDNSPYDLDTDLGTRGAAWWLLRYSAERRGGDQAAYWRALVNSTTRGLPNLQAAYGPNVQGLVRDWNVHLFTDDLPGTVAPYTGASWNFRSIIAALQRNGQPAYPQYPLAVTVVSTDGTTDLTLRPGSAAYVRFGVASGNTGSVRVLVQANGPAVPACTAPVALAVGEVRLLSTSGAVAACVAGGADYTVIPVNTTLSSYDAANPNSIPISVSVAGVSAPTVQQNPIIPGALRLAMGGFDGPTLEPDRAFERRLRASERTLRLPGSGARFSESAVASGPQDVHVALVRTR